jgi:hypothetical protein
MKIRQAITICDIDGLYDKGTVFTEFCTNVGQFYPDFMIGIELDGDGVDIENIANKRGGFELYFRWLEDIAPDDTLWYKLNEKSWEDEIKHNKEMINKLIERNLLLEQILNKQPH